MTSTPALFLKRLGLHAIISLVLLFEDEDEKQDFTSSYDLSTFCLHLVLLTQSPELSLGGIVFTCCFKNNAFKMAGSFSWLVGASAGGGDLIYGLELKRLV